MSLFLPAKCCKTYKIILFFPQNCSNYMYFDILIAITRECISIARNSLENPQECRIGKHFAQCLQRALQSR